MRFALSLTVALAVALGLFWLMQWLIAPPAQDDQIKAEKPAVQIMRLDKPPEPQNQFEQAVAAGGGGNPAPRDPPPVPGLERPSGIPVPAPRAKSDFALPDIKFDTDISASGALGQSFGGFGSGGAGGGAGGGRGGGYGSGQGSGSGGPDLVPLSTARPQIPKEACDRNIEGYAVASFNVTPRGQVTNIRIVDAKPRGLFEQPMIQSLQYWLYPKNNKDKAFGVSWKFEFELKDCKLNWD